METLKNCPICHSQRIKTIKQHVFSPTDRLKETHLPKDVTDQEERLWIYFHKLVKQIAPAVVSSTQCFHCDFIFSNPRLSESDIQTKYQTIEMLGFDQKRHQQKGMASFKERSARIHKLISQNLPTSLTGQKLRVLDYGGAEGYLLLPFIDQGHEGCLIDFVEYEQTPPQVQYLGRDLSALNADAKFDIILLLHTLEHVIHPIELVKALGDRLSPNGIIYIEVPLGAWLEWEFLREPVTHVNFFSETSLNKVAELADLYPYFMDSGWQWVTTYQIPCINLLASKTRTSSSLKLKPIQQQMNGLSYYWGGARHNFKYYTKLLFKHYLHRLGLG